MNISFKTTDNMIKRFKEMCAEDIISKVETQQDKLDAMELFDAHTIYPISSYIKYPEEIRCFIDVEMGCYFDKYMVLTYYSLLDYINTFLFDSYHGFQYEKEHINDVDLHFLKDWYKLSEEEIYSKCVDILYQYMINNKLSGFTMDW